MSAGDHWIRRGLLRIASELWDLRGRCGPVGRLVVDVVMVGSVTMGASASVAVWVAVDMWTATRRGDVFVLNISLMDLVRHSLGLPPFFSQSEAEKILRSPEVVEPRTEPTVRSDDRVR